MEGYNFHYAHYTQMFVIIEINLKLYDGAKKCRLAVNSP